MGHRGKGRKLRGKLSFANITSFLALFVALSATSYAAIKFPANSVGTKQIKTGAVTKAKLGKRAVDGSKVVPGSLTGTDIAPHSLTGSKVVPGSLTGADIAPQSLTGANINLSALGKVPSAATADSAAIAKVEVITASGTSAPAAYTGSNVAAATATCPSGLVVLGGGVHVSDETDQSINDSYPNGSNAWTADVFNGGPGTPTFTVYAICAPAA
jgi:hypothetical protein